MGKMLAVRQVQGEGSSLPAIVMDKHVVARVATGAAFVGVLAIALPIAWAAVQTGVLLLGVGIVGVVGMGFAQLLPFLGQKWENKVLALRKAEARENPIEQLQNSFLKKREQVKRFKDALASISSQISAVEDMIATKTQKNPKYGFESARKMLEQTRRVYEAQMAKLKQADEMLKQFGLQIEEAAIKSKISDAAKLLQDVSGEGADGALNQLLDDEAFRSVADRFNSDFAALQIEASLNQVERIDLSAIADIHTVSETEEGR